MKRVSELRRSDVLLEDSAQGLNEAVSTCIDELLDRESICTVPDKEVSQLFQERNPMTLAHQPQMRVHPTIASHMDAISSARTDKMREEATRPAKDLLLRA